MNEMNMKATVRADLSQREVRHYVTHTSKQDRRIQRSHRRIFDIYECGSAASGRASSSGSGKRHTVSSYRDCTMARKPSELVDLLRRVAELLQQTADLALRVVGALGS